MAQPPEDENFFSRWSKRKRVTAPTPQAQEAEPPSPEPAEEPDESLSDEELAALPSLDQFTIETDIRPFLQKGVPQALRNAALRKKWLLTPAIRDHADPAVDYAWDWNTPGGVPGDGAAPSAQRAAEMLRELTAPRCNAASLEGQAEREKSHAVPASGLPDSAAQNTPVEDASKVESPVPPQDAQAPHDTDNSYENQSDIDDTPPRRRHGGALPD
ncbi:DUF3306 domain-containing protein [Roseinatronobacter bogoriensis]|uniref:DUF3306 domain-containing protein n=1 Tax=Roseinatronobacter bogoriensis subsp. barguzinensis TaxID=441209 RepID=A0A2K8KH67_9RHOB|nr:MULTISPECIES: DUF3306 domain-containing protein [Rhodobaca]ATX67343.1 DUF3306 domain-containing protein [Rhodobaca barguzinensis]MBB4206910.1 hypothetical protein [Rhodobaca bogoriensis DSM 18756]TDW41653.1 uncharacterized protein DUF3306 [Rhodobaca barguzinensis]TDY74168.1 uncharacterized protein DUF3306 [Rhodobaca bogoriensis DSM 18756]